MSSLPFFSTHSPSDVSDYIWELAQQQSLIDDLETTLQVFCLFHQEKQILYLVDDYYHIPVAIKHITNNPRQDLLELACLWLALIEMARGKHAPITT